VVEGTWRKETELKALKDDLIKLDREIQLSLKPIEESEGQTDNKSENSMATNQIQSHDKTVPSGIQDASKPSSKEEIKGTLEDRFAIASANSQPKVEKKEPVKGIKF